MKTNNLDKNKSSVPISKKPLVNRPKSPAHPKGLGKGLGALLSSEGIPESNKDSVIILKINDISPNGDQPRKFFDESKLSELADSIKANGIIMPIIVRKEGIGYKIVAGERRWRASKLAGMVVIPAIVRDLTDLQVMQQALIENIQRQDLNPIEEANALDRLIKEHKLTQEKLSTIVGKSRPAITNSLRLLNLPDEVLALVVNDEISAGHARSILSLASHDEQIKAAQIIIQKDYSVRDTENYIKHLLSPKKSKPLPDKQHLNSVKDFEIKLSKKLATKVKLKDKNKKGSIIIEYFSYDELDRIYELLTGEKTIN